MTELIDKIKERSERFYKNSRRIQSRCKWRKASNKYYNQNKDKVSQEKKEYYERHKDKIKKKSNQRYHSNKSPITDTQRKYNKNYHNRKYNDDVQYKLRTRLCNRFNNAINNYKKNNKFTISQDKNIDYKSIIEHLKPLPEDIKNYHIDHIVPLDFFDLTDEEQLRKAWDSINFQWLRMGDNSRKNNIVDFEKYPEQKAVFSKLRL